MTLDAAVRLSEIVLGLAIALQSLEHRRGPARDRPLFTMRVAAAAGLVSGVAPLVWLLLLLLTGLVVVRRCLGPYNGGSDRLALLLLTSLTVVRLVPSLAVAEVAAGYASVQVTLSYAVAGWVKLANPAWRRGEALRDVFAFSAYPVSEALRAWAARPALLVALSWVVILFEIAFPLALAHPALLLPVLAVAALFHAGNAMLFGLNRFLWTWLAAYPLLVWFQARFVGMLW